MENPAALFDTIPLPQATPAGPFAGGAPWLLFLGEGLSPAPGFYEALAAAAQAHPDAAGLECRTLPGEQDHPLDGATLETPFFGAAAFAVPRDAFERLGGFDPRLPSKWAAVDLARRLRADGGTLYYVPGAVAFGADEAAFSPEEYLSDARCRLLLACKYGGIWPAKSRYLRTLKNPRPFPGVRKALLKGLLSCLWRVWPFLFWRFGHRALFAAKVPRFWEDVDFHRGPSALDAPVAEGPLVSVVVRTHARAASLRRALLSIAHQTYPNWEAVVVEDGEPTARAMVEAEFAHLPVRYHATGQHVGRSRAGNLGLETARGQYLCFLDDDDTFYPEHLETLIAKALAHPEADLVLGTALVARVDAEGRTQSMEMMHFDRLDVFTMSQMCQIPIQSVLFKKELYAECGGLDERLSAHEDWAMWLRFLARAKRIDPRHVDVDRATSVFTQTADAQAAAQRMAAYMENDEALFGDESIRFEVTLADMRAFHDGMLADVRHLRQQGLLDDYLEKQARREISRD